MLRENHIYEVHCEILHSLKKSRKMTLLEIMEINKHLAQVASLVLNDHTQFPFTPVLK